MRPAILALAILLSASPALASGGGGEAEGEDKGAASAATDPAAADPNVLEMPMLVAPVTVNGRLYHYAYMRVLLKAKDGSTADKARDKVPYIVDAMLRETHRESIALNGDPAAIDGDSLKKRLLVADESIMGAGAFETISFRDTIQTDDPNVNPPPPEEPASAPAAAAPATH